MLGPVSDFPTRKWLVEPALHIPLPVPILSSLDSEIPNFFLLFAYLFTRVGSIRVPDKDLVVVLSPILIEPPPPTSRYFSPS